MNMLKAKQRKIVNIAWEQVEKFIKDWQRSPNEWYGERDIQIEIASRLKMAYRRRRLYKLWAKYKKPYYGEKFIKQGITMSRVDCEPPIYRRYSKTKYEKYRPDIIVWDDIKHPENPCEFQYADRRNDPMLWVCEIKYRRPWERAYNAENERDKEKLNNLLKQNDGTKCACLLNIAYHVDDSYKDCYSNKPRVKGRMRIYNITLPED